MNTPRHVSSTRILHLLPTILAALSAPPTPEEAAAEEREAAEFARVAELEAAAERTKAIASTATTLLAAAWTKPGDGEFAFSADPFHIAAALDAAEAIHDGARERARKHISVGVARAPSPAETQPGGLYDSEGGETPAPCKQHVYT